MATCVHTGGSWTRHCVCLHVLHRQAGGNINDLYLWQHQRQCHQYTPIRKKTVPQSILALCVVCVCVCVCVGGWLSDKERGSDNEQRCPFSICVSNIMNQAAGSPTQPLTFIINGSIDHCRTFKKKKKKKMKQPLFDFFFVTFSYRHVATASCHVWHPD